MFINSALACNKAENPFEKKIPIFKIDTENYGLRDFYSCSELHKGSFSFKCDLFGFPVSDQLSYLACQSLVL